ncbi:MAG: ATP-binding cassette domain-containing protein, partial [Candidatus Margulisiibacteriota bacterium]
MIKIKDLYKDYNGLVVLNGVSVDIPEGETLAVIGPSGCGKSTLLRLILRLEEPTKGSIEIDGQNISRLSEDGLIKMRRKIGMVFQSAALFDSMSVYENVAFALREQNHFTEAEIKKVVNQKLELV